MSASLHHVRLGAGPPLLLLHGVGMSGAAWRPVAGLLAARREVWAIDLPGFGRSPAPPAGEPCDVGALADAVQRFLAATAIERPHVAGNSLGGAVGLELGRRGAVASVTALSPAGFGSAAQRRFATLSIRASHRIAARLRPVAPRLLRRPRLRSVLYAQMFARPAALSPAEAHGHLEALLGAPGLFPVLDELEHHRFAGPVPVPCTIAWGTRDWLLVPTQALRARRRLPAARHVWLQGCGHVPMSDDPAQVARVLLEGSTPAGTAQNAVDRASG